MLTDTASCSVLLAAAEPTTLHTDMQVLRAEWLHVRVSAALVVW
jgi:hypothetical protein